jgi:hypothetical protein
LPDGSQVQVSRVGRTRDEARSAVQAAITERLGAARGSAPRAARPSSDGGARSGWPAGSGSPSCANQLEWFDGEEARVEWQCVRRHFITEDPHGNGDIEWTGGRWEDEEGRLLLMLIGHC